MPAAMSKKQMWARSALAHIGALLIILSPLGSAMAQTRVERFLRLQSVTATDQAINGPLSLSQDGLRLIFMRGDQIMLGERRGATWRFRPLAIPAPGALSSYGRPVPPSPKISPDGRLVAFWSSVSGTRQLWIQAVESGQSRQLTEVEGGVRARTPGWDDDSPEVVAFAWSPQSDAIIFSHSTPRNLETLREAAWLTPPPRANARIYTGARGDNPFQDLLRPGDVRPYAPVIPLRELTHLYRVALASREVRQLTHGETSFYAPIWSIQGVIAAKGSDHRRPNPISSAQADLFQIDPATGAATPLTSDGAIERSAQFSPDGNVIAFARVARHFAYRTLCVLRITASTPTCRQFDVSALYFSWFGNRIAFTGLGQFRSPVHLVDASTLEIQDTNLVTGEVGPVAASAGAVGCLWIEENRRSPSALVEGCRGRQAPRSLLATTVTFPENVRFRQVELRWRANGGEIVTGMLFLPGSASPERLPPLIFYAYPNSAGYRFLGGRDRGFLALGYAILKINSRPPHTWMNYVGPESYTLAGRGLRGPDVVTDDLTAGLRAVRALGVVNVDRTCGYGFSNGGGVLAQVITRTDALRCAVIVAPAHVDSQNGFFDSNYAGISRRWAGDVSPWENPEHFIALSPLYRVNRVQTPTLIAVGGRDESFVMGAIGLFNGLRANGADTSFLLYPNDGHNLGAVSDTDLWSRIIAYLDAHLMTDSAPR